MASVPDIFSFTFSFISKIFSRQALIETNKLISKHRNVNKQIWITESQLHKIISIKACHRDFEQYLYWRVQPPESVCRPVKGECLGIVEVSNGCCWNIKHYFTAMQRSSVFALYYDHASLLHSNRDKRMTNVSSAEKHAFNTHVITWRRVRRTRAKCKTAIYGFSGCKVPHRVSV